jgi:membrane fusion protein (multidrug efflux system)
MKNLLSISFVSISILFFGSCTNPKEKQSKDPASELAELHKLVGEYNLRIKELEKQIANSDTTQTKKSKAKLVGIDTLENQNFNEYIDVQGIVDAKLNILVAPQMPAVVTSILVKEGDFVTKGKVLAILDGSTIRQGMQEIKTGLEMANTMYLKQKSLWEQNIGSEAQYLQAKNQKEQLEEKLKSVQTQLNMTYIKAPVSGTVDEVKVKIGEIAAPGFAGIRIVNNSDLTVRAKISDLYSAKIHKGDKVGLYFPDLEKELNSKIDFIGQTVNMNNRTITVESNLPPNKLPIKTNQLVKLKINNGIQKNVLVVPTNIIQKSINGEDYILVAEEKDGQLLAKKRIIKAGSQYNGQSVILSGLQEGDRLITVGYSELVDGQMIQN